jgi:hypothetical protein
MPAIIRVVTRGVSFDEAAGCRHSSRQREHDVAWLSACVLNGGGRFMGTIAQFNFSALESIIHRTRSLLPVPRAFSTIRCLQVHVVISKLI